MQSYGWNIARPFIISTRIPSITNSSIGWRSIREIFRLWMKITRKVLFLRNDILWYLKGCHLSLIIRQNPTLISRVHAITYVTWNCSVIERCFVQWGAKSASHDKDRRSKKPIFRVSICAHVLTRSMREAGFCNFCFSSLDDAVAFRGKRWKRAPTTKEDEEMTRYREAPVELFSPVESGVTVAESHLPRIALIPSLFFLFPVHCIQPWLDGKFKAAYIFSARQAIRRHHRRVSTVRFFDSKSKLHCLFTETFRSFSIVFILAAKFPLFHDLIQISFHVEDHRETYLKFYPSSPIWFTSLTFNLPSFVWVSNVFHQDELDHNFQSKLNEDVESSPGEGQRFHSPFTRRLDRSLNYRGSGGSRYDRSTTEPRRITARRPFTLNRKQLSWRKILH